MRLLGPAKQPSRHTSATKILAGNFPEHLVCLLKLPLLWLCCRCLPSLLADTELNGEEKRQVAHLLTATCCCRRSTGLHPAPHQ